MAGNRGGFEGPGPDIVSVEQAGKMADDARVALRGHIVRSLGGDDYVFRDETGEITVEIPERRFAGQTIVPADTVEIHGKVDKDWSETEIDVKRIIKR